MIERPDLNISDYEYELPPGRIAQYPLEIRDASRLLIFNQGRIQEDLFRGLSSHLPSGSLLVRNNTRVVQARLLFQKPSGARVEIFCLEPISPHSEITLALQSGSACIWKCLVGNARKWKEGSLTMTLETGGKSYILSAEIVSESAGIYHIRFSWPDEKRNFAAILEDAGRIPLPPYISREADANDNIRYQTVYASNKGSVAAPTAGLHFTEGLLLSLEEKDIHQANVTLHVGAGTFKPVTTASVAEHTMHTEQFSVNENDLNSLMQSDGPIVAVGTTSLRTLESLYWLGVKLHLGHALQPGNKLGQWDAYEIATSGEIPPKVAWESILKKMQENEETVFRGETQIMITPTYRICSADILITNFHQPRSTLLLLVAAFVGAGWREAYDYALDHDFRFLSYGDACLFFRKG